MERRPLDGDWGMGAYSIGNICPAVGNLSELDARLASEDELDYHPIH